jgi:hypothetical protein
MRKFLLISAVAVPLILGGCTAAQIESGAATIEADIQAGAAAACGVIPTVTSILDIISVLYPPGTAVTAIAAAGISAIEKEICTAAPPISSARLRALPLPGNIPAVIGQSSHGVVVSGWRK